MCSDDVGTLVLAVRIDELEDAPAGNSGTDLAIEVVVLTRQLVVAASGHGTDDAAVLLLLVCDSGAACRKDFTSGVIQLTEVHEADASGPHGIDFGFHGLILTKRFD